MKTTRRVNVRTKKRKTDDKELKIFIKSQGYQIEDKFWAAGLVTKTKPGDTKILQVVKSFRDNIKNNYQTKEDRKDKLLKQIETGNFNQQLVNSKKKEIEKIEKEQVEMKKYEELVNDYIDSNSDSSNLVMVFSLNTRAIASQSTKVAWTSCMNLEGGQFKEKVGSGIASGAFVVFLAEKDEIGNKTSEPKARVLVKPFFDSKKKNVFWFADQVYPRGTNSKFRQAVTKLLKQFNMDIKDGNYKLPSGVYDDGTSEVKVDDVYRYVQIGDFSDLQTKPKKFIEKMFERYPKEIILNWDFDVPFPDIEIETLDLSNTDIRKIPKGIKARNWNLSGTNIGPVLEL